MPRAVIAKEIRKQVKEKLDGHCAYCGELLGPHFCVDHVIPVAKGGIDDLTNLYPSCKECNLVKSDYSLEEFRELLTHQIHKASFVVAVKFGQIEVKPPVTIQFFYEKCGIHFDEDLVKALMTKNPRPPES